MRIEWSPRAKNDAIALVDYISIDNPVAARRALKRITTRLRILASHPYAGRPGRLPGMRELVITGSPFIAIYKVGPGVCRIESVIHAAQLYPPETP
jgi:plasmid stabilization system protein ParE